MITLVEYLVIAAVIGVIVFALVAVVFGRGEQLPPLPARTSPAQLPAAGIRGDDVRHVRFGLALRGYRMSDVDWTLDRLAAEIDDLRGQLESPAPLPEPTSPAESVSPPEWASPPEPASAAEPASPPEPVSLSGPASPPESTPAQTPAP